MSQHEWSLYEWLSSSFYLDPTHQPEGLRMVVKLLPLVGLKTKLLVCLFQCTTPHINFSLHFHNTTLPGDFLM